MANHKTSENMGFFKDKDGLVILWQWPGVPLYGWIIFKLLSFIATEGTWKTGFAHISTAFLFTWAFLELTDGVNYFRKLLGLLVLVVIAWGYFK